MNDVAAIAKRLVERLAACEDTSDRSWEDEILARYDEVDAKLVAKGFPATSPWWRATIERWIRSRKVQLTARVGRRGGKSSSLSRLAVVIALYGRHVVPPGDVGTVAVISTDRGEALGRLHTIEAILDALGIAHRPCVSPKLGLRLVDRAIEFRVFAATIKGVSGFTSIFVLCDEVAKWRDADTGVNPATTVLASVRPTMATQPNARMVLSSSPMGRFDAHYDAFEEGDTELQTTAHAPTWVANPTITEAQTRLLEPDELAHSREYGAVPQSQAETSLLTEFLVDRVTRALLGDLPREDGHYYVAAMDPATRGNAWTLSIGTRGTDDVRRIVAVREKRGNPSAPLSPRLVFAEWAPLLASYGIVHVHTDQWAVDALQDSARDSGLVLLSEAWSQVSKAEGYEGLLKFAQDKLLDLPPEPQVKTDLLGIRKVLTRTGVSYELAMQNGRHSDFAPCIAMTVMHAHVRAQAKPRELPPEERHVAAKVAFLEGLARDRKRAEKFGAPPITHRSNRR